MSIAVQTPGVGLSEFDLVEIGKRGNRLIDLQDNIDCARKSCPDYREDRCEEGGACGLLRQVSVDVERLVEELRKTRGAA